MKNTSLLFSLCIAVAFSSLVSCGKKDTAAVVNDPSFGEDFDTLSKAVSRGWVIANNSKPIGTIPWVQGFFYLSQNHMFDGKLGPTNPYNFDGFSGVEMSYSGSDFAMATANSGHGSATISNWLISPVMEVKNGDVISFYTRTASNPADAADRLQVRLNPVNSSADVGRDALSVGNFSEVLLDINPTYLTEGEEGYPGEWTQYSLTISGLTGSTAKKSRIAFRYFVEDGGPGGSNSVGVGIDKFEFISK